MASHDFPSIRNDGHGIDACHRFFCRNLAAPLRAQGARIIVGRCGPLDLDFERWFLMQVDQLFHRRLHHSLAMVVLCVSMLGHGDHTVASTPQIDEILTQLGFNQSDAQGLMTGKILSNDLEETSDKELAITIAMFIHASRDQVVQAVLTGKTLEVSRDVLTVTELDHKSVEADALAAVALTEAEADEASKFLRAAAGSTYNLSQADIDRVKDISRRLQNSTLSTKGGVLHAANDAYRLILADRLGAYQQGGVRSIGPYERGRGKRATPDKELTDAAGAATVLAKNQPAFYRAFAHYPRHDTEGIEHHFYCFKQRVEGRPCFILAHRMFEQTPDHALITERQFYVGHTYNSLQIVAGCLEVAGGTIVFYTNRTSTDQVAGMGSGLKHSIGRRQMLKEVTAHLKTVREAIEKQ